MDSTICGINKIICKAVKEEDYEKAVTITGTTGTQTVVFDSETHEAVFLIPSIPAPAKEKYMVSIEGFVKDIWIGYGEVIEIYMAEGYDYVTHNDFDEFKEGAAADLGVIKEQLTQHVEDADDISFRFGVDENGRYGYKKAGADTVTPFRDGSETLCYRLGQGRTFDIKAACTNIKNTYGIDLDYTKLTKDNFVAQLKSSTASGTMIFVPNNDDTKNYSCGAGAVFNEAEFIYNSSTGTLSVDKGEYYGTAYGWYASSAGQPIVGSRGTSDVGKPAAVVYLIISMN